MKYICKRCGVPVGYWGRTTGPGYWKHHNSGTTGKKACDHVEPVEVPE